MQQYGLGFAVLLDKELVKDRVFAAFNVFYEPSWTRVNATGIWEKKSTLGFAGAITNQIMPGVLIGGEARYLIYALIRGLPSILSPATRSSSVRRSV